MLANGVIKIERRFVWLFHCRRHSNGIAGSAVCSFNLTAINAAFNGPFKHQATVGSEWVRYSPPHQLNHGHCQRQDPNQILDSSR